MKRTSFQTRLLFGLVLWIGIILCGVVSTHAQPRAIKPVRIEAKTAQNETVSYIYAESHALVIGVSQYRNGWSNLPGVQEDVEEVSRSLKENGFQVTTIKDPGLDELENAIEDFIFEKGARTENRLLIYYAGHGHTMTLGYGGEMGFLVPADAPVPEKENTIRFQRKVLSMQRIEEVAKSTSAKHVLFMFDACFAGSVFLATRAAPAYIQQNTKEPVRQFITSGSAEQEVPDKSIFRRAFVDALNGKADYDKDGYLTGTELGAYIQKRTAEDWEGRLTPQYGKLQDPNLNKGDFVFELSKPLKEKLPKAQPNLATQAWAMIEQSENPAIFQEFIEKFPDAPQRQLAELKLMLLSSDGVPAKPDTSSPEKVKPAKLSSNLASPTNESDSSINLVSGANERYRWTPAIVEDKQRKLIWQRQDNGERTFELAKNYCDGLRIAGFENWRLPEIDELRELPVESDSRPDGTSELFSELRRGSYWSGALLNNARVRFQNPWDDKGGIAGRYGKDSKYTLCVSNTTISAPNISSTTNLYASKSSEKTDLRNPQKEKKITLNSVSGANERYRWTPAIVEDKQRKLIWQRQDNGERTFELAKNYCDGLRIAGFENWRLPEIDELRELPVESDSRPDGTSELFSELRRGSYWSGALLNNARVRFQNPWDDKGGIAGRYGKDSKYTLCVSNTTISAPNISSTTNLYASKSSEKTDLRNPQKEKKITLNSVSGANERYRWTPAIVEDKQRKLIWQRQDNGERTFELAKNYCDGLRIAGFENWRLPEIDELRELPVESDSRPDGTSELFSELRRGSYWSGALLNNARVRFQNPWDDKGGIAGRYGKDSKYTLCVRSSDGSTPKSSSTVNFYSSNNSSSETKKNEIQSSFQKGMGYSSYQKISESTGKVIGCGFFHVGCLEEPLKFPPYQPNFHIKDYRRVNLWGKDRPWTDTGLQVEKGDRIYFYGTGEVTTCSHSSCSKQGPQNLRNGSITYAIGLGHLKDSSGITRLSWIDTSIALQVRELEDFRAFQGNTEAYWQALSVNYGGTLDLTVRDWDTYPPPSNYYEDNSGVYILDIFVIDPGQEEGFNRFKDALFKANPNDLNARAYLGN